MLIFERSHTGRRNAAQAPTTRDGQRHPAALLRQDQPLLPEASEMDVVRHYNRPVAEELLDRYALLSARLLHDEIQPACLQHAGDAAAIPGASSAGPEATGQGVLACLHDLQEILKDVTGMAGVSLMPMAGAQGEFAGIAMIRAYHESRGDTARTEIIVPDARTAPIRPPP